MTSPTQPKSTPVPALLVYGTPTSPELTQASWFRAEDTQAAKAAAVVNFSVLELKTAADRAVTLGVHAGRCRHRCSALWSRWTDGPRASRGSRGSCSWISSVREMR